MNWLIFYFCAGMNGKILIKMYLKNEPQQFVRINSWIIERWNDEFLYWNPLDYGFEKKCDTGGKI